MDNLLRGSHVIVECECEFQKSPVCKKVYRRAYRDMMDNRDRNNGKFICFSCSRLVKYSGRKNPNAKYNIDDSMFKNVDTEIKAYLLGWIASDGGLNHNGSIRIAIHKKDKEILNRIVNELGVNLPIKDVPPDMVVVLFSSKEMVSDVSQWLGIDMSQKSLKKDRIVRMPNLNNDELKWAFIRGFFDGDGSVRTPSESRRSPDICIASYSPFIRNGIADFCKIPCIVSDTSVTWSGNNALEFLSKIYPNKNCISLGRKYDLYRLWSSWTPSCKSGRNIMGKVDGIKWSKTRMDAVPPSKTHITDSGYDITITHVIKTIGTTIFYGTGLKVAPPFGYYFDLVPRSSISKTGYMMANSLGIIDRTYTGEIIVAIKKIDQTSQDIELPCKIAQIIPRQIVHFEVEEVEDLEETLRSNGGFGSTNK